MINKLKDNSSSKSYLNELNNIYYSLNDVIPINNYTILSDIGISYPGAEISSLQNLSGNIYLTDPKLQYVYSISDTTQSTPTQFERLSSGISIPQSITYSLSKNSLFLYDTDRGLFSVALNGTLSPIIGPVPNSNISSIQSYMGNIYMLDSSKGIIYNVNTTTLSYTNGLKSKYLVGARSFAVDGNIFVIDKSGNIVRFYANTYTPFAISNSQAMEYSLNKSSYIYDNQYSNYIYIVDPAHYRIVVLQKPAAGSVNTTDYKFVKQYVYTGSNKSLFSNITDLSISASGKSFYLLSGTKIIKIFI